MKKGFLVGQSNEVVKEGKIYDLHNEYDFSGIAVNGTKQLRVLFEPNSESGSDNMPVSLLFDEIDYLELSRNFGSRAVQSLDELGYKTPDDHDNEWLLGEQQASNGDHLFIRLDGVDFIRVHSRSADLVEASTPVSL